MQNTLLQKRMPGDEEYPRQQEFHEKDLLKVLANVVALFPFFAALFAFFAFSVTAIGRFLGEKTGCRERQYRYCATAYQTLQELAPFGLYLIQDGIDSFFLFGH
jgi:hypothetical protein